jgi:nitroimidazol reductase NimA-like FMN-containing flavoprotein (pyridoxamine 5'-phosphate oxidase superfamily)
MPLVLDEDESGALEVLGHGECLRLLEESSIGRVAVSIGALPAIFPVSYAMSGGAIYFLTGQGTKLSAALRGAAVAFEIDHADLLYHRGWSVLAIGEANEPEPAEAAELSGRLSLRPWASGVPSHLVRIRPDFVSGRRITFAHPG